jgi:hypothetical protein
MDRNLLVNRPVCFWCDKEANGADGVGRYFCSPYCRERAIPKTLRLYKKRENEAATSNAGWYNPKIHRFKCRQCGREIEDHRQGGKFCSLACYYMARGFVRAA